jgi:Uma2 family endonuclease
MSIAKQLQNRFTYADYLKWPEDERWELIDGVAYVMAAPGRLHQETVLELGAQVLQQLRGTSCKPYIAPFDVRLAQANETDDRIETVVQPDLAVICDKRKLDDKGCRGAPAPFIRTLWC